MQWDSRLSPGGIGSPRHTRHGVPRWVWVVVGLTFLLLLLWFMASRGGDSDNTTASPESGDIAAAVRIAENRAGYSAIEITETDQNGRIVLTGNLPTLADRLAAEKVAVSVANVIDVDNQITTDEVEPVEGETAAPPVSEGALLLQRNLAREVSANPIFFASASAELDPVSAATLDRIAGLLGESSASVVIEGHTDSDGEEQANLELSSARAQTVLDQLVTRGIDPARLTAQGFGESQPVASNESKEGKAKNRRIEFVVAG